MMRYISFFKPKSFVLKNIYQFIISFCLFILIGNYFMGATDPSTTVTENGFTYSLYNDTNNYKLATVTEYSGADENVVIPGSINDHIVTTIGEKAFFGNTTMKSIEGSSIKKIENSVKNNDTNLYEGVFADCTSLENVNFSNLIYVGKHAFDGCTSLANLSLPNTTFVGDYSFRNCSSLEVINLPNATFVGSNAFYKSGAQAVSMPKVTYVGDKAFKDCAQLETVNTPQLVYCDINVFQDSASMTITLPNIIKGYSVLNSENDSITNAWVENNFDVNPVIATIINSSELDSKITEIASSLSQEYNGLKIKGSTFATKNNPVVPSYPVFEGKGKYYPVKFAPNNYDQGIVRDFTDVVYLIKSYDLDIQVSDTEFTYNGNAQMPTVVISDERYTLIEGTDYELVCADNINAGEKTLTIHFIGDYSEIGDKTYGFTISKANVPDFTINIQERSIFTGSPIQLILSIGSEFSFEGNDTPDLYLRIADNMDDLPTSSKPWIKYITSDTLSDSNLKRTAPGKYYIY